MSARDLHPSRHTARFAGGWRQKFRNIDRKGLYDIVTSLFLDCQNDEQVARELTMEFDVSVGVEDVREMRIAASREGRNSEDPNLRRRWCLRFGTLSVDTLAAEYMLLEGKQSFIQAKNALADEISDSTGSLPAHQLWIAINEALGRNNISLDLIKEYQHYAAHLSKIRQVLDTIKWRADVKDLDARIQILSQMVRVEHSGERKPAAEVLNWTCEFLRVSADSLNVDDVDFLLEYSSDSSVPNAQDESDIVRFGRDKHVRLVKASAVDDALHGDVSSLDEGQIREFQTLLLTRSLMMPATLKLMHESAKLKTKARSPEKPLFIELRDMLENLLTCSSAAIFFSGGEKRKARSKGVSEVELHNIISDLNALPSKNEARIYIQALLDNPEHKTVLEKPLQRYLSLRWCYLPDPGAW